MLEYMFLATSLLSVCAPLLHRPLRQYGAVRLHSDIMGKLKESRAYHHHDSHDGLCLCLCLCLSLSLCLSRAVFAVTDGGEQNDVVLR